jgi:hypothetical protein
MKAKEYISEKLTPEQFAAAMDALPLALERVNGTDFFTAVYGFGCNLHSDLLFVPMRLLPNQLTRFLEDSISQHIFQPGDNDLHISVSEGRLTLTFCHEGDIHIGGNDRLLAEQIQSVCPFATFRWKQEGGV